MIEEKTYQALRNYQYGALGRRLTQCASWALWAPQPQGGPSKAGTADLCVFAEDSLLSTLNPNYVFVGLNVSGELPPGDWSNFHAEGRRNDYRLRFALQNTRFWGGYITDIIKDHTEVRANQVRRYLRNNPNVLVDNIKTLLTELGIIGRDPNCKEGFPVVIAMGNDAFDLLRASKEVWDHYQVIRIPHFSDRYRYPHREDYRERVIHQLETGASHVETQF